MKIGKTGSRDCAIESGVLLTRAVDLKLSLLPEGTPEMLPWNEVVGADDQECIYATGMQLTPQIPHLARIPARRNVVLGNCLEIHAGSHARRRCRGDDHEAALGKLGPNRFGKNAPAWRQGDDLDRGLPAFRSAPVERELVIRRSIPAWRCAARWENEGRRQRERSAFHKYTRCESLDMTLPISGWGKQAKCGLG